MERPSLIDNKRGEHADRVEIDNKGERLNIVNVIRLCEAVRTSMNLLTCNCTIRMIFEGENRLACDSVSIY